jgi:hypothetical protein
MKKYLLIISISICFVCCNNNAAEPEEKEDSAVQLYGWEAGLNDSTGKLEMKKSLAPGPDSLTVTAVLDYLNKKYKNVRLHFIKASRDSIYLSIPEAEYLTQQMGSTGPQLYFADMVYNLTEIAGIQYVNVDFEEGDHAVPGVMNRDSFKDE